MSDTLKVPLRYERWGGRYTSRPPGGWPQPLKSSLPFASSRLSRMGYVHRIRSGLLHMHPTSLGWSTDSHLSFRYWCNMSGGRYAELHADVPDGRPLCATCEGRAIGAGEPPAAVLVLRPLQFTPREGMGPRYEGES